MSSLSLIKEQNITALPSELAETHDFYMQQFFRNHDDVSSIRFNLINIDYE